MTRKDIIKRKKGEVIYEAKIDQQVRSNNLNPILFGLILFIVIILIILLF